MNILRHMVWMALDKKGYSDDMKCSLIDIYYYGIKTHKNIQKHIGFEKFGSSSKERKAVEDEIEKILEVDKKIEQ